MVLAKQIVKKVLQSVGFLKPLRVVAYFINNCVHLSSEFIYRLPNPLVRTRQRLNQDEELKRARDELQKEGIVVLDAYLKQDKLQKIQADFDSFVKEVESSEPGPMKMTPDGGRLHPSTPYADEGYSPETLTTVSNNPFKHSASFLKLALDPFILEIIAGYIGKRFMLQQATALRCYPNEKNDFGSWQWHHDSWGRKINVMFLFTEVTEKDQHMSYMKGSNKFYHSLLRTSINDRFTQEEVDSVCGKTAFRCLGKPGTVFIFDANGFHRGNRNLGAVRDTLIVQYTAGRYLWPFDIPEAFLSGLSKAQRDFLELNPNINVMK